jgi:hypothetical protein
MFWEGILWAVGLSLIVCFFMGCVVGRLSR